MDDQSILASVARLEELASRSANVTERAFRLTKLFAIFGLLVSFIIVVLTLTGVIKVGEPGRIISIVTSVWCTVLGYYFGKTSSREADFQLIQAKEISRLVQEARVIDVLHDQNQIIEEIRALRSVQPHEKMN